MLRLGRSTDRRHGRTRSSETLDWVVQPIRRFSVNGALLSGAASYEAFRPRGATMSTGHEGKKNDGENRGEIGVRGGTPSTSATVEALGQTAVEAAKKNG